MWFAALGSYKHNPWLIHLMYRLLIGQPEVLELLDQPPFDKPPLYVRAKLYTYHYTSPGCHPSRYVISVFMFMELHDCSNTYIVFCQHLDIYHCKGVALFNALLRLTNI